MIRTLERSLTVHLPRERVFAFFADARNLARITPPAMGFKLLTPEPIEMYAGLVLDMRVRVFGKSLHWQSLIRDWNPPEYFVDEQLSGPYRRWVHTHRFREVPEGTAIEDQVRYELPYPPLGELAHPLVRRQLEHIFDYRREQIEEIFGAA